jgi:hypothetical protein
VEAFLRGHRQQGVRHDRQPNDFELFSESWEAMIPKVIEAYKVTSTLCDTRARAIDVANSAFCSAS